MPVEDLWVVAVLLWHSVEQSFVLIVAVFSRRRFAGDLNLYPALGPGGRRDEKPKDNPSVIVSNLSWNAQSVQNTLVVNLIRQVRRVFIAHSTRLDNSGVYKLLNSVGHGKCVCCVVRFSVPNQAKANTHRNLIR